MVKTRRVNFIEAVYIQVFLERFGDCIAVNDSSEWLFADAVTYFVVEAGEEGSKAEPLPDVEAEKA